MNILKEKKSCVCWTLHVDRSFDLKILTLGTLVLWFCGACCWPVLAFQCNRASVHFIRGYALGCDRIIGGPSMRFVLRKKKLCSSFCLDWNWAGFIS
jgi:hypothetical protein